MIRLLSAVSIVFALAVALSIGEIAPAVTASQAAGDFANDGERSMRDDVRKQPRGQAIFRYDTFGDEQLWTDVLRMHEVIATVADSGCGNFWWVFVRQRAAVGRVGLGRRGPAGGGLTPGEPTYESEDRGGLHQAEVM